MITNLFIFYFCRTKLSAEALAFLKKFITSFLGNDGPDEIVEAI